MALFVRANAKKGSKKYQFENGSPPNTKRFFSLF
jgi:hypothetical protein